MKIGQFDLEEKVLIVAEIGNNHEGNFEVAKKLVREAANCGVDAVKFQTFKTEHYVSHSDTARFERLKSFELSDSQFSELAELARSLGLMFLSTPFDLQSAEFLNAIVDAYKISSSDNTFYPLLRQVALTGKPIIVSSGLSDLNTITSTVAFLREQWNKSSKDEKLAVLHCVSSYPVPPEEANLRSIPFLADRLNCTIGYSDHTLGLDAALLSIALGARIIEKHFTLDRNYSDFRDHQLSADPREMTELVKRAKQAIGLLGNYEKTVRPCEGDAVESLRRSTIAVRDLPAGHFLTPSDLTWVRPGGGLSPGQEEAIVGKRLERNVNRGDRLSMTDVALEAE